MIMLRLRQTLGKHELQGVALVFEKSTVHENDGERGRGEGRRGRSGERGRGGKREVISNKQQATNKKQETRNTNTSSMTDHFHSRHLGD